MSLSNHVLEVSEFTGEGYQPLVDFGAWRVAILRYIAELEPHNITKVQRHNETDEVFVLLEGRCILFLSDCGDTVTNLSAVDMQPLKLYNVKRAAWHTHTLSKDASVLIVENQDTTYDNSPSIDLDAVQKEQLVAQTRVLWG